MNIISEAIKRIKNHLNNSLGIFLTVQTPWTVTGKEANKLLDRLEKQYPKETPVITYISKEDALISSETYNYL